MSDIENDIEFVYTFNDITYLIYIKATPTDLSITLETLNQTNYWHGNWEANEIEEISIKAKSHKTYQVFTKMLKSALTQDSRIVKLELLSYSDLQDLKKVNELSLTENKYKIQDPTSEESLRVDPSKVKTKYLIIKYNTEFEVTQFPLRLLYVDKPTDFFTSRTIKRLRLNAKTTDDLDKNSRLEFEELKTQVTVLKGKIKLLECSRQNGAVENEEFLSSINKIKNDFDKYIIESDQKILSLNKTLTDTKHKMGKQIEKLNASMKTQEEEYKNKLLEAEEKYNKLGDKMAANNEKNQKLMDEDKEDFINMVNEIQHQKEVEKKLLKRITRLENEIEINERNMMKLTKSLNERGKNKNVVVEVLKKSTASKKSISSERSGRSGRYTNKSNFDSVATGKKEKDFHNLSRKYSENQTNDSSNYKNPKGKIKGNSKYDEIVNIRTNPFDKEIYLSDLRVSSSNKLVNLNNFCNSRGLESRKSHKSVVSNMSTATYHSLVNENAVSSGYGKKPQPSRVLVISSSKSRSRSKSGKDEDNEIEKITKNNTKANAKLTAKEYYKDCDHGEDVEASLVKINRMIKKYK